jgi:hypothetical protein
VPPGFHFSAFSKNSVAASALNLTGTRVSVLDCGSFSAALEVGDNFRQAAGLLKDES